MSGLAIACPGQGAQHPDMFGLALQSPQASSWLKAYSDAIGADVVALAASGENLFSNKNAQILVCAASAATWIALADRLPVPILFLGYSVGEMSAYGCAGIWTAQQLALLVAQRAAAMDRAAPPDSGMMAVTGMPPEEVNALCVRYRLEIAIVNGDDHLVLAGPRISMHAAAKELEGKGQWYKILDVAVPSHSSLMSAAVQPFRDALAAFPRQPLTVPVVAGITGVQVAEEEIASTLAAQISETVQWAECMRTTEESGVRVVLELAPGKSLSRMFETTCPAIESRATDDFRTLAGVEKWVRSRLK